MFLQVFSAVACPILGVIAAFLQITATITLTTAFLWVVDGVAVGALGSLLLGSSIRQQWQRCGCTCTALNTLLISVLGSIFFAVVLLAVGIIATSILSAILVGLLILFFSAAFLRRHLFDCRN